MTGAWAIDVWVINTWSITAEPSYAAQVLEGLTVDRAGDLLADLLPERGPVRAVARFDEGSITGAYRVEFADTASAAVVLKCYEPADAWFAAKEARALSFLTAHGVDISPRMLAFRESAPALDGRPCLVSSLRPGRTLTVLDAELTDAQRHELYRQLGTVLRRLHAIPAAGYGYINGEILDPLPDNAAHMARIFERDLGAFRENTADAALAEKLTAHVAERASMFTECARPAYCHGDVHEPNLLAELAEDGACSLTGLLDPGNMHAGDPLMDLVRLDAFSMDGDATKLAGLLSGYGAAARPQQPGQWPESWRPRIGLYRIALALELHNWFTITGATQALPGLESDLRAFVGESAVQP